MSTSSHRPIRTTLLLLLIAAALFALVAPVASAADAACPVAECVIDDGLANAAGPDPVVDVKAGAPAPQEISDDADDLGVDGVEPAQPVTGDTTEVPEPTTNVDADHPIGDGWSEGPRVEPTAVAGATRAPAAAGSGVQAWTAQTGSLPTGELPFTGGPSLHLALLGLACLLTGLALRAVRLPAGRRTA